MRDYVGEDFLRDDDGRGLAAVVEIKGQGAPLEDLQIELPHSLGSGIHEEKGLGDNSKIGAPGGQVLDAVEDSSRRVVCDLGGDPHTAGRLIEAGPDDGLQIDVAQPGPFAAGAGQHDAIATQGSVVVDALPEAWGVDGSFLGQGCGSGAVDHG